MTLKTIKLGNRKRVIPIHEDNDASAHSDIIAAMRAIIKQDRFETQQDIPTVMRTIANDRATLLRYLDQLERMS